MKISASIDIDMRRMVAVALVRGVYLRYDVVI